MRIDPKLVQMGLQVLRSGLLLKCIFPGRGAYGMMYPIIYNSLRMFGPMGGRYGGGYGYGYGYGRLGGGLPPGLLMNFMR